jgi:hypothetical protein
VAVLHYVAEASEVLASLLVSGSAAAGGIVSDTPGQAAPCAAAADIANGRVCLLSAERSQRDGSISVVGGLTGQRYR